jgi:hypothetical protein
MPHEVQPYYLRQRQEWAVQQEHLRHNEAIYHVGEWTMFVLMWHLEDFEAGRVQRCTACYTSYGRIAEAYQQPAKNKCPDCFGTTFEGGYRARIVRPSIFTDTDEDEKLDRRGIVSPDDVQIETTSDFRIRSGDYAFRGNGTRWQLRVPERITLRTGFGMPTQGMDAIGYNSARAQQENETSVAFLIPPTPAEVAAILNVQSFFPKDFSTYEDIRGALIPPATPISFQE